MTVVGKVLMRLMVYDGRWGKIDVDVLDGEINPRFSSVPGRMRSVHVSQADQAAVRYGRYGVTSDNAAAAIALFDDPPSLAQSPRSGGMAKCENAAVPHSPSRKSPKIPDLSHFTKMDYV